MRTSYFAHAILWYADFMMLRLGLLSILVVTGCRRDRRPAVPPPIAQEVTPEERRRARQREALAQITPANVSVDLFSDGGRLEGRAATFDDVSALMRGLNNIILVPQGFGRVVERQRDGGFRVELLDGGELVELGGGGDFLFSGLELLNTTTGCDSTEPTERTDGGVTFTLKFGATEERGTVPP
ncbi:MAG: hypothetical protein Q8M65_04620 [Rhodoglobus sp.]|nr:hypothetical protein [Rhodoglobus sp.]